MSPPRLPSDCTYSSNAMLALTIFRVGVLCLCFVSAYVMSTCPRVHLSTSIPSYLGRSKEATVDTCLTPCALCLTKIASVHSDTSVHELHRVVVFPFSRPLTKYMFLSYVSVGLAHLDPRRLEVLSVAGLFTTLVAVVVVVVVIGAVSFSPNVSPLCVGCDQHCVRTVSQESTHALPYAADLVLLAPSLRYRIAHALHIPTHILQVIFFSEGGEEPTVSHPRLVVRAGADAHLTLTQSYLSQGGVCLSNGFTRVEVGDRATVVRRCFLRRPTLAGGWWRGGMGGGRAEEWSTGRGARASDLMNDVLIVLVFPIQSRACGGSI